MVGAPTDDSAVETLRRRLERTARKNGELAKMCEYEAGLRASLQARLADEQRSQREREAVWRRKLEEAERARSAYTCRVLASQREGLEQQHRAALQAAFERHASELRKRQKEFDEREAALVESLEAAHRIAGRRDAAETDKVRAQAAAYACRVLASQREGMEKILADRHAHERRALELELRRVRERLASVSPPADRGDFASAATDGAATRRRPPPAGRPTACASTPGVATGSGGESSASSAKSVSPDAALRSRSAVRGVGPREGGGGAGLLPTHGGTPARRRSRSSEAPAGRCARRGGRAAA
jgi:hypothetical protein